MGRPNSALVVDDEPHVVLLLRGLLKQLGVATIWEALDGTDAIAKASANKPDLVLLDLNLPPGDGFQVLEKLKLEHPSMHVIIVSAQSTLRTLKRARELGADGFVVKYAPKSDVLRMLSEVFDSLAGKKPETAPDEAGTGSNREPPDQD
jgi:DNA-binding NarL/FixJ family response regulator